jgi:putative PIN family toxin of toxin-antitoxin system
LRPGSESGPLHAVVLDTSTLVRAVLGPASAAGRLLDRLIEDGRLPASLATLAELEEVLARPKFAARLSRATRRRFLRRLALGAWIVQPDERVQACRDPDDDKFLELALAAGALAIASDDRDLLALDGWRGIRVLKPEAALVGLPDGR